MYVSVFHYVSPQIYLYHTPTHVSRYHQYVPMCKEDNHYHGWNCVGLRLLGVITPTIFAIHYVPSLGAWRIARIVYWA